MLRQWKHMEQNVHLVIKNVKNLIKQMEDEFSYQKNNVGS